MTLSATGRPAGATEQPAAATAQPVTAPPSGLAVLRQAARSTFEGTPGRMRVYGAVAVAGCLLFGLLAFVAASSRSGALSSARSDAAQLVRVQAIRTNLVFADANLTNAFLVGGLEPPAARSAYEQGIATASQTLADAAGANTRDAAVLARVNDVITRYTGLVESARSNNRLGYPLGAAYLREAATLLRTSALPALEDLGATEQSRVDDAYSASARAVIWGVVGLLAALAALIAAQVWLSARTRRLINLPLLAATGGVLVVGAILLGVMAWSQSKADHTRENAYFATVELASARIDAFDAKSAESLTLIARGSGQAYEARYKQLANNATAVLDDAARRGGANEQAARQAFVAYGGVHTAIRNLDDKGNWDAAVADATGSGPTGSNAAFGRFDQASGKALDKRAKQLHDDLGTSVAPLLPFGWFALVIGAAAAVASARGMSTRLREYR
jgi:hypothetical protein